MARTDTSSSAFDLSPCGGMVKGQSHSLIDPESFHPVTWSVYHSSDGANCTIRLLNSDLTSTSLKISNAKTDANGWFPCARKETNFESVTIEIPKEPNCQECVLQFICKTFQGSLFQCSDIQISASPTQTCKGKCKNGGNCSGNMCVCKSNYIGTYCETEIDNEEHSSIGIFFLFVLLLVVTSVLLAVLYYWKNPEKMPKVALGIVQRFLPNQEENHERPSMASEESEKKARHEGLSIEVKGRKHSSNSSN